MDITNIDIVIHKLSLSFFKGLNCNLLAEDAQRMSWEHQENFLKQTIQSAHFKMYPCNRNFCVLFFKKLIQCLELKQEVHDDIYEFLCSIMKTNEDMYSYRYYVIKNNLSNIITIKETKNMVVNGTTGLRTWEAALMLSDWALFNKELFSNKNILELGSGVGLTGITIAKLCNIRSMIMTDCHSEVLKTINDNILINFPSSSNEEEYKQSIYKRNGKTIGSMILDWNDVEDLSLQLIPDVVIGADIVYDPSILEPLIHVFTKLQKLNTKIEIYIASVIRNPETFRQFLEILDVSDFSHQNIALSNYGYIDWDDSIDRCLLKINKES